MPRSMRIFSLTMAKSARFLALCLREVYRDGGRGLWRFCRHSSAILRRERQLRRLEHWAKCESLTLDKVFSVFHQHPCAEEDQVVAEWFGNAHSALEALAEQATAAQTIDLSVLRRAARELGYIVEAKQFFRRWPLPHVHAEVTMLYQSLIERIDQLVKEQAEARTLEEKKAVVEEKRLALEAIKEKKAAIAAKQALVEEERKKLEAEKALRQAKAEEHREAQKRIAMEQALEAQRAEAAQQAELEAQLSDIAKTWESQLKKD